jgi:hypothetical protein
VPQQDGVVDGRRLSRDRADAQLRLEGRADLACDDDVERCAEHARDLVGDGYAAARQGEHHGLREPSVSLPFGQLLAEGLARLPAVTELHGGLLTAGRGAPRPAVPGIEGATQDMPRKFRFRHRNSMESAPARVLPGLRCVPAGIVIW